MNTPVKYNGSAPGADANTYNLFNTTELPQRDFFAVSGVKKFQLLLVNADTGTLKEYKSDDGGTTWIQIDEIAVAASAAKDQNAYEWVVEPYRDWKLDWVNGGSAQTTWSPSMALVVERAATV